MAYIILHGIGNIYYINTKEISGITGRTHANSGTKVCMTNGSLYEVTEQPSEIFRLINKALQRLKELPNEVAVVEKET
jgi:hypothetical protein